MPCAARAGVQSIGIVDGLTDARLIADAEKSEKTIADALRRSGGWLYPALAD